MRRLRDQAKIGPLGAPQRAEPWPRPILGQDRRWTARAAVRLQIGFREPQKGRCDVRLVNFSRFGCAIESDLTPEIGAFCWMKVPTLESWYAKIAWRDGNRFGLDFVDPFHPAVADMVIQRARRLESGIGSPSARRICRATVESEAQA
jgi:hypothetical protein